jgi:hypothetical protein
MKRDIASTLLAFALTGCASLPDDTFELPPSTIEDRLLQSRIFATTDEGSLLAAGASVLQDLGYVIDEATPALGLLTASKEVSAVDGGQIVWALMVAALGVQTSIDRSQKVNVCLVIHPRRDDPDASVARITVQRSVYDVTGALSRVETLNEPTLYQEFFDKLAKAAFLEANAL